MRKSGMRRGSRVNAAPRTTPGDVASLRQRARSSGARPGAAAPLAGASPPSAAWPEVERQDVAVVVRSPQVDRVAEAAGALVAVIGDVRKQVGRGAVGPHDHPVLVIVEAAGAQPGRLARILGFGAGFASRSADFGLH